MNIDLGYLGKVVLQPIDGGFVFDMMHFVLEGYTESGIRVYAVIDQREYAVYPTVWRNAILIKV